MPRVFGQSRKFSVGLLATIVVIAVAVFLYVRMPAPTTTSVAEPTVPASPTAADPTPTAPAEEALSDARAREVMTALRSGNASAAEEAITTVVAADDRRFVAVFIELMRAAQIGIVDRTQYDAYVDALETLSGEGLGDDWAAWIEWYGGTDLTPPPGFAAWKGRLLSEIDPGFGEFLQADAPSRIRVEEIVWGGVRVDGIPALDNPSMLAPDEAPYLDPHEPVFGIALNGEARAYPLRILDWHEMANDVVGGVPVSLAYCTLCGAAIAYNGRAADGTIYTFGSSGFLYRSNKLMYDRQTRTLWNQLTGEPVLGELAGTDVSLELLPVVLTTWTEWQAQHPETLVLDVNTGYQRPYELGAPYGDYFSSTETMFPVWQRSTALPTKSQIYALQVDGVPKAYPIDALAQAGVINDTVDDTNLVLVATRGVVNTEGTSRRAGPVSYTAGSEVRAFERGEEEFAPGPDPDTVLDSAGRPWQVTEEALIGPDGETAPRVAGHLAYWFGWYSFFPDTLLYEQN